MWFWDAVDRLVKLGYDQRDAEDIVRIHYRIRKITELTDIIELLESKEAREEGEG